ncbi:hypothetical protein D3C85_1495170 [compost metagenome]
MPPMNSTGMNTASRARVMASTVKPTSRMLRRAAGSGRMPCCRWRAVFSTTTMASSTTKPVAMISAISDRLLRL